MVHYLFLLMFSTSEYGAPQAHQDSLFVYNAYKQSAKILEQATKPGQMDAVEDSLAEVTADALIRLSKFNHQTYEPAEEFNKEGVGAAYSYPEPSAFIQPVSASVAEPAKVDPTPVVAAPSARPTPAKLPQASTKPHDTRPVAFKVLDRQTRFIVKNGKTTTPYVVMNYYATGRILVRTEKLNPVTFEPIETEDAISVASSN